VLTVNQVGDLAQHPQIVEDGDRRGPEFGGHVPEDRAVCDRPMPAIEHSEGEIADVQLRAASAGERLIREQDPKSSHWRPPSGAFLWGKGTRMMFDISGAKLKTIP
jgi:hypothetical protein